MNKNLKAPFPYFGGKGMIADAVWEYLGDVKQYIEPFFGSGAVLLKRPPTNHEKAYEIVCDKDGFIANVWRSIIFDPDEVAKWCDWPINHVDLNARRKTLLKNEERLLENLCNDPEWYDAKMAGYWIWAASCWIGGGLTRPDARPHLTGDKGVHSQRPHLARDGGIHSSNAHQWLNVLSERLRYVKVVCGDWSRVCGGNWQDGNKPVGIFFDPPYATDTRAKVYQHDCFEVGKKVEKWCLGRGENKNYRIITCGYDGEYKSLINAGWHVHEWKASGGYGNKGTRGSENRHKERLFISPHCLRDDMLF